MRSAKALGLMLHMHRGTPYIYQGEELGMTDAHFTRLDQYRDLESLNAYRQRVEEAKVQSPESMLPGIAARGRDNSRTPMQWDGSVYAGFTAPDAAKEPWISVNPNHAAINAAGEFDDPDSVYAFYKQLIALRHDMPVVAAGICSMRMTRMSTPSPAPSAMRSCWSWSTCPAEPLIYRAKPPNWPPPESPSRTW